MFLKKFLLITLFVPLVLADGVLDLSPFRSMHEIEVPTIELASEVKVYLSEVQDMGIALVENESGEAQATASIRETQAVDLEVTETSSLDGSTDSLVDGDYETVAEFDLDDDAGAAYLIVETSEELTSSKFSLSLDDHVALPYEIAIKAYENGSWSTVVARTDLNSSSVSFPETSASKWKVELWHSQPLRVREVNFVDANPSVATGEYIVWLARPGETYTHYTDAAVYTRVSTTEGGDLLDDEDAILEAALGEEQDNPFFIEPDDDEDGVANYLDNCVNVANADQEDLDENGLGDACEDHDGDGVVDSKDNCPEHANRYQDDEDGDGIGDECDDEESRITEKFPWLSWLAMGLAAVVILGIVIHTIRSGKPD